jgi:hypothetical protein
MNVLWSIGIAFAMILQQKSHLPSPHREIDGRTCDRIGQADLIRDVYIPVREPGVLERLLVKEGDWVVADQAIAELDRKMYELDVQAATK